MTASKMTNVKLVHRNGGAIKSVEAKADGWIEGYLVAWGSPSDTDLQGEHFTPETEFCLDWFKERPVLYHHGLDGETGLRKIGTIKVIEADKLGLWVQAQLDLRDRYASAVYDMVKSSDFGWSSGSVDHLVKIAPNGQITTWPIIEGSITPTPAQPAKTSVRAFKSNEVPTTSYRAFKAALSSDKSLSDYLRGLDDRMVQSDLTDSNIGASKRLAVAFANAYGIRASANEVNEVAYRMNDAVDNEISTKAAEELEMQATIAALEKEMVMEENMPIRGRRSYGSRSADLLEEVREDFGEMRGDEFETVPVRRFRGRRNAAAELEALRSELEELRTEEELTTPVRRARRNVADPMLSSRLDAQAQDIATRYADEIAARTEEQLQMQAKTEAETAAAVQQVAKRITQKAKRLALRNVTSTEDTEAAILDTPNTVIGGTGGEEHLATRRYGGRRSASQELEALRMELEGIRNTGNETFTPVRNVDPLAEIKAEENAEIVKTVAEQAYRTGFRRGARSYAKVAEQVGDAGVPMITEDNNEVGNVDLLNTSGGANTAMRRLKRAIARRNAEAELITSRTDDLMAGTMGRSDMANSRFKQYEDQVPVRRYRTEEALTPVRRYRSVSNTASQLDALRSELEQLRMEEPLAPVRRYRTEEPMTPVRRYRSEVPMAPVREELVPVRRYRTEEPMTPVRRYRTEEQFAPVREELVPVRRYRTEEQFAPVREELVPVRRYRSDDMLPVREDVPAMNYRTEEEFAMKSGRDWRSYAKSLERMEAPAQRNFGRIKATDEADRPGAYINAFKSYLRVGENRLNQSEKYVLEGKGQERWNGNSFVKSSDGAYKTYFSGTDSSIGYAVPPEWVNELNKNIQSQTVMANECRTRNTTSDVLVQPNLVTNDARRAYNATLSWPDEQISSGSVHRSAEESFTQLRLPINVMMLSVTASNSSLEDVTFDLEGMINEAFSERVAVMYDELIWSGDGQAKLEGIVTNNKVSGARSTGMSSVGGYIPTGNASGIVTADTLKEMLFHLPRSYRQRAKWFMNSNTGLAISQLKDGNGRYLIDMHDESLQNVGVPDKLLGKPILYNEYADDIESGLFPIILADLSKGYLIGKRVDFSIRRFDDSTQAEKDQVLFLGRARVGGQVWQPAAIKVLKVAVS